MRSLRVLIVDDDKPILETLREFLEENGNWKLRGQGFRDLEPTLMSFRPDLLVLDLVEGSIGKDSALGNQSFAKISERWFCPVVVYTAHMGREDFDHPLVRKVVKGAGSEDRVLEHLEELSPYAEIIRTAHEDFDVRVREALRDSMKALHDQIAGTELHGDDPVLSRAVRRLVAARVDDSESGRLHAWERFVVPPLGEHLLTADLLRKHDSDWTEINSFRLVLTPSCDLISRKGKPARANKILVARCEWPTGLGSVPLEAGKSLGRKAREKLVSMLQEGLAGQHLPIPEFRGHVPLMAANFKRLELLDWTQVPRDLGAAPEEAQTVEEEAQKVRYVRVASTDSPFREMVTWAYLQIAGRPGLPSLDVEEIVSEISTRLESMKNS